MDIKATYEFGAPPDRVWAIMMDPESLARCMPGCENLTPVGDGQYTAALSAGVGAIKGRFQAKIALTDLVPPSRSGCRCRAREHPVSSTAMP